MTASRTAWRAPSVRRRTRPTGTGRTIGGALWSRSKAASPSTPATCVASLPRCFTRYIAASAASSSPSAVSAAEGNVAMPIDAVNRLPAPRSAKNKYFEIRSRTRRATARAPSTSVSGSTSANSSPPNRATMSVSRALLRITAAASTRARLPSKWPCASLIRLNPSRSTNSSESGRPLRTARFVSFRRTSCKKREL